MLWAPVSVLVCLQVVLNAADYVTFAAATPTAAAAAVLFVAVVVVVVVLYMMTNDF